MIPPYGFSLPLSAEQTVFYLFFLGVVPMHRRRLDSIPPSFNRSRIAARQTSLRRGGADIRLAESESETHETGIAMCNYAWTEKLLLFASSRAATPRS